MGRSRTPPEREGSLSSTGSGRTARSKKWDGETGHRLHLSDLPVGVSKHEIEKLFRPYGELNEIWVASNPPCFAFINFLHRSDGERALKDLNGTIIAGARVGLSWARARHYGGRSRYRSPSPRRRNYRDSYDSRRRRYSRSRSRSPRYRRSGGYRRRSPDSRSPSPRDDLRTSSKRDERRRRRRSTPNSDRSDRHSERRDNGKRTARSPSNHRERLATPNGDNLIETHEDNHNEIEVEPQD